MKEWCSTTIAAQRLGTTIATVRRLVDRGDVEGQVVPRPERRRWLISVASVEHYLHEHGRIDRQRARRRADRDRVPQDDLIGLRAEVAQLRRRLQARPAGSAESDSGLLHELSRCRAETTALRSALLELRARQEPLTAAAGAERAAAEHMRATVVAQGDMIRHLREALTLTDAAVGQFAVPGLLEDQ